MTTNSPTVSLNRTLGLFAITAFGVGDILGSGVYGLVGKIAGEVGNAAWMSYVVAGLAAALTGLTYAELTSRFPKAGGAAHFCNEAFRSPLLTFFVMYAVVLSGLFSIAATSRVFADYAMAQVAPGDNIIRDYAGPIAFAVILAFAAVIGIMFSSRANIVCTIIEVTGLALIIFVGIRFWGKVDYLEFSGSGKPAPFAILSGATLAFFAFVGFEDMVNLSEEVKDAERNVPLAICFAILITSAIYCLIAVTAVSVLRPVALTGSKSPLIDVVKTAAPGFPIWIYSIIPAFAVFNTGLLNLLMSSRLLYGMASGRNRLLPPIFGYIHPRWRTPVIGVIVSVIVVMGFLIATKQVSVLASGTTTFLLGVFTLLHLGLLKVKFQSGSEKPRFRIPWIIPLAGAIVCAVLLSHQSWASIKVGLWLGAAGLALFLVNWYFRDVRQVEAVD